MHIAAGVGDVIGVGFLTYIIILIWLSFIERKQPAGTLSDKERIEQWKHATADEVLRALAEHEHEIWHLEPLIACLDHPEWWESGERLADQEDVHQLYRSTQRGRVFTRNGGRGVSRYRSRPWRAYFRARR